MQGTPITLSAAFVLGLAATSAAQESPKHSAPPPTPAQSPAVDVTRLPLDLSRIQRGLRSEASREAQDGLNLRYFINVYAPAPPLVLFTPEDNLLTGPVPYSAPTHRDMIEHVTPQEHRAPPADFSALLRWLKDRKK
jgi:hypothetical protein